MEGSQRPRRRQRIAAADPDLSSTLRRVEERLHQGRLADAGLSLEQHHPPGTVGGLVEKPPQVVQLGLPLE